MNMNKGRHRKAKKTPILLIISLVLLLIAAVGGTVAYLRASSDSVTNTFKPAVVTVNINENKDSTTKSNISFTNPTKDEEGNPLDTVPVYVRAKLVIYWTDTFDLTDDGVDNPTEQIIAEPADAEVVIGSIYDTLKWFLVDDIYYYREPVVPGASTAVMLDPITVTVPDGSTAQCHIDIHAEAIQAEPASVAADVWGEDITVNADGTLQSKK